MKEKNVAKIIIIISYGIFSLLFFVLSGFVAIELLNSFIMSDFNFELVGYFILAFELAIAGLKAIMEGGHFPLRYLIIFLISALVFYVAVNKSTMDCLIFGKYILGIIFLLITYLLFKKYNPKDGYCIGSCFIKQLLFLKTGLNIQNY